MSATIFNGRFVKSLKPGLNLFNQATIWSGNIDPSVTGFTAPTGDLYISTLTNLIYSKVGGADTNWQRYSTAGTQNVETRTITSGESTAKALTLVGTPVTPSQVILDISGAPSQIYSFDYTVSGSTLSWSGLGLDGLLTTGDNVRILYWT